MHKRERGTHMQIEATSLKNLITANSKMDFEIGTLSSAAKEKATEDKVFIGCGENDYLVDSHDKKSNSTDKNKDKVELIKDSIDKLKDSVIKTDANLYEEMGFAPEKDDVSTLVTVSDRIKIQMAKYSDNYQATGSKIDVSVLEAVTGSQSSALRLQAKLDEAYNMVKDIGPVDKGSEEYLLKNNLEPTINNVYLASHSGATSRDSAQVLTDEQWKNVKPQVEDMLEKVGIDPTQERLDNSKWIIEQKIPLTPENVIKLEEIKSINVNMTDSELLNKMMNNVLAGISPKDTLLTDTKDYLTRAVEAMNVIELATPEEVNSVVASDKELTIANLNNTNSTTTGAEIENITAKRLLEETRLMMTIESNVKMLKNGINIEIQPLKDLVSQLESYEKEYYSTLYSSFEASPTNDEIDLLKATLSAVEALKSVPSPVIGKLLYDNEQTTVSDLTSKSQIAMSRYEESSTQVRSDLGDSYGKAFSSIESILKDLELETNAANEKAVKILAYNNIDITGENVSKIKTAYEEFSRLMDNLKPKTAAYLISEKINPLNTDIATLNKEIEAINSKIGATEEEKYSEFLWKLDKNNELSKEERDAFIGTYRLMYMVEKGDFSAIGSLIKQGSDITLNNLATAVKSKKAQNMNVKVNDSFGETTQIKMPEVNINAQLGYFSNLVKDCREKMTPENLNNILKNMDLQNTSLETLASEIEMEYESQSNKGAFEGLNSVSDDAIQSLLDTNQKVNSQNLVFAGQILGSKRGAFKYLEDDVDVDSLKFTDSIEDSETMDKVYEKLSEAVKQVVSQKLEMENPETIDINKLKMMSQSVQMLSNLSLRKQYQIPLEVNGEACLVKLTVISNSKDSGKVTIESDSENSGKISSEFRLEKDSLKGIILTDSADTNNFVNSSLEEFVEKVKEAGINKTDIRAQVHTGIKDGMWKEKQTEEKVETKNLYKIAKIFIEQIVQKRGTV